MSQVELFLNSVPILANLSREERIRLVDAFEEVTYQQGQKVITEGDKGDLFYIVKEGEAIVYQNTPQGARKVNHLFKADFFGERALLKDEPRQAGMVGVPRLRACPGLRACTWQAFCRACTRFPQGRRTSPCQVPQGARACERV